MPSTIFTVALGFARKTAKALLGQGRTHVTMLTGNPDFPTPTPTTAIIGTACDKLEAATNAYDFNRGKLEKEARDLAVADLKFLIRELGGYVQANCKGESDLILSTGFNVRRDNTPIGQLPAPKNVLASTTLYPGRIDLRWDGVKGRSIYEVWMTDGDPSLETGWKMIAVTPKPRFTVKDLKSNVVYTFRLVAQGPTGASPASDVAKAKAA